jgi:transcriptional regulator of aromatic amino acid metabolism
MARALHAHHGERAGPLSEIDGPLMDAELLEFTAGNILAHLDEDRQRTATLLVKQVGGLADDAAERLRCWLEQFPHLRCLCTAEKPISNLAPTLATRLATLQVTLPRLTKRVKDLPLLLAAQLHRQQGSGTRTEGFSRGTLDHLSAYPWPGDFEEMEEAVRHAVRVCPQGIIQLDHLPLQIRSWTPQNLKSEQRLPPLELDRILSNIEAELIRRTLIDCQQNRTEAASRLGISRARLIRRISELKLSQSPESASENRS